VNEHHINIRGVHDAKQGNSRVVYFNVPRGWFEEGLRYQGHSESKKKIVDVVVYWEE